MAETAISICIPAYRQPQLLRRCLESIQQQTFTNYEIIITDDSPDNAVEEAVAAFQGVLPIRYQHNGHALGAPENWNAGLRLARGRYIKMMHQDDWFAAAHALEAFYESMENDPQTVFAFSACNYVKTDGAVILYTTTPEQLQRLSREPEYLLLNNFIGAPSTGIFRRDQMALYDAQMKWLVDLDQYIRLLATGGQVEYISDPLVNIGAHVHQVTQAVQHDREVVIREHLLLLTKLQRPVLRRLAYFDFYWRMFRNLGLRSAETLMRLGEGAQVPAAMKMIAACQARFSPALLKKGLVSKSLMLLTYYRSLFSPQKF